MTTTDVESAVKSCYSTWSERYYREYYGPDAEYPPVHRELVLSLLAEATPRTLLDAGCGPASFLRHLAGTGIEPYGFDLTPEMVQEACRVLGEQGVAHDRVWAGSVLEPTAFCAPDGTSVFDAAVCIGVLPHIEAGKEDTVIANLRGAVANGGLVVIEARNQLFSLFSLNRYTYEFFLKELIRPDELYGQPGSERLDEALRTIRGMLRMDQPPLRRGTGGAPGYDEVLSRCHNPLLLTRQVERAGFRDVRVLFYHHHRLPPFLSETVPELFAAASHAGEDPEDWRGHFMASAFLVTGRRA